MKNEEIIDLTLSSDEDSDEDNLAKAIKLSLESQSSQPQSSQPKQIPFVNDTNTRVTTVSNDITDDIHSVRKRKNKEYLEKKGKESQEKKSSSSSSPSFSSSHSSYRVSSIQRNNINQLYYLSSVIRSVKDDKYNEANNKLSLTLSDIISGEIEACITTNFIYELSWFLENSPGLMNSKNTFILHGNKAEVDEVNTQWQDHLDNIFGKDLFTVARVRVNEFRYGTHHSKCAVAFYASGIRVAIFTNNFIELDWTFKTQGCYVQDFPLKAENDVGDKKKNHFENDLMDYFMKLSASLVPQSAGAKLRKLLREKLPLYDFSSANGRLVASVPGNYTSDEGKKKYGHFRVKDLVLNELSLKNKLSKAEVCMQFTSMGNLYKDQRYLFEVAASLLGEESLPTSNRSNRVKMIWPTFMEAENSVETQERLVVQGLMGNSKYLYEGGTKPLSQRKIQPNLEPLLCKWSGASLMGRQFVIPHIKTYIAYCNSTSSSWSHRQSQYGNEDKTNREKEILYILLTSCNLSSQAFGMVQKSNGAFVIHSWELGILFSPETLHSSKRTFSNTPSHRLLGLYGNDDDTTINDSLDTKIPVPYQIPPIPYMSGDRPYICF